MAKGFYGKAEGDAKESAKFNYAALQNMRMNDMIKRINHSYINLSEYDEDYGKYNYELLFRSLNQIRSDINSKLEKDERKDVDKQKMIIEMLMKKMPPIKTVQEKTYPYKKIKIINENHLDILGKELEEYQLLIQDLLDSHGFANPTIEDDWRGL